MTEYFGFPFDAAPPEQGGAAFPGEPGFDLAEVEEDAAGTEFEVGHAALESVVDGASGQAQATGEGVLVDLRGGPEKWTPKRTPTGYWRGVEG